jgi:hypothetical protein
MTRSVNAAIIRHIDMVKIVAMEIKPIANDIRFIADQ